MLFSVSAMDWIGLLLTPGIGGLIGATIGAYLKAYSAKKGERLATYEDIEFLLAQERGKAYEQEKGKRLATHEDIQNVLNEVRVITKETETIKAQIGGDLWLRQTVWNHKREAYASVVRCSHALQYSLQDVRAINMRLIQAQKDGRPELDMVEIYTEKTNATTEYVKSVFGFFNALTEAELFVVPAAGKVFNECRSTEFLADDGATGDFDPDKSSDGIYFLCRWTDRLISVAKQDLGVEISVTNQSGPA